jgi:hypothetical protein
MAPLKSHRGVVVKAVFLLALAMTVIATPVIAQETPAPAPACPATPVPLPPAFAGWASAVAVTAAASPAAATPIQIGKRADISLLPADQVQFAAPEKAPAPGTSSGLVAFTVSEAGTYQVALGAGAWIDVVRDGKPTPAGAHGHGPACTAVRKIVDFALTPGSYLLQIAGSKEATISVLVFPHP